MKIEEKMALYYTTKPTDKIIHMCEVIDDDWLNTPQSLAAGY